MWTGVLALLLASGAALSDSDPSQRHVRSLDPCVEALYRTGVSRSPSFRAIVDRHSLAVVYRRIGFESSGRRDAFESMAAIVAGRRIRRELSGGSAGE